METPGARETVAANVRRLRTERGWSLGAVSAQLCEYGHDLGVNTLSKIENNARGIDVEDLVAFASVFDVPEWVLLSDPNEEIGRTAIALVQTYTDALDRLADAERLYQEQVDGALDDMAFEAAQSSAVNRGVVSALEALFGENAEGHLARFSEEVRRIWDAGATLVVKSALRRGPGSSGETRAARTLLAAVARADGSPLVTIGIRHRSEEVAFGKLRAYASWNEGILEITPEEVRVAPRLVRVLRESLTAAASVVSASVIYTGNREPSPTGVPVQTLDVVGEDSSLIGRVVTYMNAPQIREVLELWNDPAELDAAMIGAALEDLPWLVEPGEPGDAATMVVISDAEIARLAGSHPERYEPGDVVTPDLRVVLRHDGSESI